MQTTRVELNPTSASSVALSWLKQHTDAIESWPEAYVGIGIAVAAGLGLYMELMIVRFHSSFFQLFAYFKNVSLLSCFLGLGVGYARGSKRTLATPLIMPLFALQILLVYAVRYSPLADSLQNPVSEQLGFGVEQTAGTNETLITYGFMALIFILNALCFIPLGHLASRLMARMPALAAYGWNLAGSLAGIFVFSLVSFMWTPPIIWIILAALGLVFFLRKHLITLLPTLIAAGIVLVVLARPVDLNRFDIYSPYQVLALVLSKDTPPVLETSNTYYQRILNLSDENVRNNPQLKISSDYYSLPYYFKPNPEHVMIVGSGSGNDAAAALRNGAGEVDAVEIDPAILQFGRQYHPESPYQSTKVIPIVDDARAFIRHTDKQYDLIVYGLLDSHTLLSGSSGGIRLDSYVYTVEGLRDARQKLKQDGVVSLTFALLSEELGRKLYLMLQDAFDGQSPVIYQAGYDGGYTFLDGGGVGKASLSLPPGVNEVTSRFADPAIHADESTDDWPFFYMPLREYPISYVVMILLLLAISSVFVRGLVPASGGGFSFPAFFLGAGFMLLETKGITELALAFGSTWFVISAVITAILILAFLSNFVVMRLGNPAPLITYALLSVSIIAGLGLSFINMGAVTPWLSRLIMTAVLTLPLFFSGFAFSAELRRSSSVAATLSANLLGAMLGGFLEYNSMYFGFRSLYVFALVLYGIAFLATIRLKNQAARLA
ncbi:MAG: hypothetical protein Q7R39_03340 [Dehalococcoidia bacterium]|nr:hypothetical protein [Dehalococcoidia bacterium]